MTTFSMSQLAAEQINGKTIQAGHANRRGTTLLISRPRDFWPWLTSRRERTPRGRLMSSVVPRRFACPA